MGSERGRGGRGGKNVPESSLIREFRIARLGFRDNLDSNPASNSEAGKTRFRRGHRGEDAPKSKTIHLADFATPPVGFFLVAKRPKPGKKMSTDQLARDYNCRCPGTLRDMEVADAN